MDNVIQRALIMASGECIDENNISFNEQSELVENAVAPSADLTSISSKIKVNEANLIMAVLKETEGCRDDAAKKLNISPRTLRYKISKLKSIGLKVP